jgi:isopentenyl-diphosphate delta-isomerase
VTDVELVLPDFGYRAVDASGVVENEFCPVWVARLDGPLRPNPNEVAETTWVAWPRLVALVDSAPALLSPWCVAQVPQLSAANAKVGAA